LNEQQKTVPHGTHANFVGPKGEFTLGVAEDHKHLKEKAKNVFRILLRQKIIRSEPDGEDPTYDCFGSDIARLDSSFNAAKITKCIKDHGATTCTHMIANLIYHKNVHTAIQVCILLEQFQVEWRMRDSLLSTLFQEINRMIELVKGNREAMQYLRYIATDWNEGSFLPIRNGPIFYKDHKSVREVTNVEKWNPELRAKDPLFVSV
jgi:hypothetical protein